MSPKRILVLGATGATGQVFTQRALRQPDPPALTLYVRSRGKVAPSVLSAPQVRVVEGALSDQAALADAMTGVDTVTSFLGAYPSLSAFLLRTTTTPIADSFPAVFKAMRAHGVKRILALSTPGFYVAPEKLPWSWWFYGFLPPFAVPQGSAEMAGIGKQLAAQADLDWTVFRVPQLNNGAADLPVAAGLLGEEFKGTKQLSRASMVEWVLGEMEKRAWIQGAPVISNY